MQIACPTSFALGSGLLYLFLGNAQLWIPNVSVKDNDSVAEEDIAATMHQHLMSHW